MWDLVFREGEWLSLDDRTGGVYPGRFESSLGEEDHALLAARGWARDLGLLEHPVVNEAKLPGRALAE